MNICIYDSRLAVETLSSLIGLSLDQLQIAMPHKMNDIGIRASTIQFFIHNATAIKPQNDTSIIKYAIECFQADT